MTTDGRGITSSEDIGHGKLARRWDLIGLFLGFLLAVFLVLVLDTGPLADWLSRHKESKVDEIVCLAVLLLIGLSALSIRRWYRASHQMTKYQESKQQEFLNRASQVKKSLTRDLIGLAVAMGIAVVLVFLFDTGSIAEWISTQKETKVDEAITSAVILLVGLSFFSIRRWIELSQQLIQYDELYMKTSRLNREATLLGELSDLLQSCVSSEEAHELIARRAEVLFPGTSGALCIIANSRDLVEVVASWGKPALAERFFAPKDCWALRRGQIHVFGAAAALLSCAHLGRNHPHHAMCVPMMAHGEALGLFYLDTSPHDEPQVERSSMQLDDSEQRLARTLADQASLALANLRLREILSVQSVRDPLTSLYNRRYMEESLDRELRRAERRNVPLGVMMIDVDHFKRFNDTFGHEAGDAVLRTLAGLMHTQVRGEDVACRYGGEEFTMILPEASMEATRQRAEELRRAVKATAMEFRGHALESITLSIGISAYPANGVSGEVLLRAADSALYHSKEHGRDCVSVASASALQR